VRSSALLAVLSAALVAACSSGGGATSAGASQAASPSIRASTPGTDGSAEPVVLTIFAAASLKHALEAIQTAYEVANPGTTITLSTDSSAALETQIELGAPADVFLAADTTNPQKLADGGLASGPPVPFAGNKLTIIVPSDNPGGVASPLDLAQPGVKVIAAGDAVPITTYATQLVQNLATLPDAPAGFAEAYAANIASKEDNVSAVVGKIELGEGDAGVVYVTDAQAAEHVETVDIPDEVNVAATYAGVVVKASPSQDAARAFLDWLAGSDGLAVLARFGFLPPPS
jgi:molybdate transport system substrate-binding protein